MKKILLAILSCALLLIPAFYLFYLQTRLFSPHSLHIPSVTKTRLGSNADPIDIIIIGDKNIITNAFKKAGWLVPDKTDRRSTAKIILTSIHNTAYPSAPISKLYLFKRVEDLSFEFPTETVRKRHHIRLWRTNYTIATQQVWIGADTYDSRIELSRKDLLPTHHVDANIDKEKEFLRTCLTKTNAVESVSTDRLTFPILLGFNGNGDWYYDDGNVVIITLK